MKPKILSKRFFSFQKHGSLSLGNLPFLKLESPIHGGLLPQNPFLYSLTCLCSCHNHIYDFIMLITIRERILKYQYFTKSHVNYQNVKSHYIYAFNVNIKAHKHLRAWNQVDNSLKSIWTHTHMDLTHRKLGFEFQESKTSNNHVGS